MKTAELRQKTAQELTDMLKKFEKDLKEAVSNALQKKDKNVKKVRFIKKDFARTKTVLNEKEFLDRK